MKTLYQAGLLASAVLLSACASEPEFPPAQSELAPGIPGETIVGARYVFMNNVAGQQETSVILAVENGMRVVKNETTGCTWARSVDNPLSPPVMWDKCDGHTGRREITSTEGQIFPLQVGNSQTWSATGSNDKGETWEDSRTCTVAGTANVVVPAGAFDAYHVRCTGENRIRHYYFAPEAGRTIKYLDRHLRNNERRDADSVSFERGA